jgi:hypothetical protein
MSHAQARPRRAAGLGPLAILGVALVAAPAAAFQETEIPPPVLDKSEVDVNAIPSVHDSLYQVPEGVVSWDTLGHLEVRTETLAPLQTRFHTDYTPAIKALADQEVKLMGFIYPLEGGTAHGHFLLTAWPPSCPFCLPAGPSQMVEVFAPEPIEFGEGAVMLTGRFELLQDDPSGLYYRLHDAELLERFENIRWQPIY